MKYIEKTIETIVFVRNPVVFFKLVWYNYTLKRYVKRCEKMCVQINYKKLWIKLAELEMDKAEFRKRVDLSPNTMTKLNKNEEVSMQIILRICKFLKCDIGEICDVVFEEEK